jgi:hypothetical protein
LCPRLERILLFRERHQRRASTDDGSAAETTTAGKRGKKSDRRPFQLTRLEHRNNLGIVLPAPRQLQSGPPTPALHAVGLNIDSSAAGSGRIVPSSRGAIRSSEAAPPVPISTVYCGRGCAIRPASARGSRFARSPIAASSGPPGLWSATKFDRNPSGGVELQRPKPDKGRIWALVERLN